MLGGLEYKYIVTERYLMAELVSSGMEDDHLNHVVLIDMERKTRNTIGKDRIYRKEEGIRKGMWKFMHSKEKSNAFVKSVKHEQFSCKLICSEIEFSNSPFGRATDKTYSALCNADELFNFLPKSKWKYLPFFSDHDQDFPIELRKFSVVELDGKLKEQDISVYYNFSKTKVDPKCFTHYLDLPKKN